ncbi:GyrI-like domain-containing protein [uncultured Eudoraea sp.]|uniref:GyrI-like domain-containing protein n=1 Tax=uncultured Eudoraea sp. TaxID=1035614 RepID=UPI00260E72A9|nr:GyrI-like domain-containing protein [uncultured Eudoraea sp.]
MEKIDYKKELKNLYKPSPKKIEFRDVPKMNFLMIEGTGDPNTSLAYKEAIEALFSLSYTLKFMIKKGESGIDYSVMPLEGLWWVDDMSKFDINKKENWKWTAMIMQPEAVTKKLVAIAIEEVRKKKNPKALSKIRFEAFSEGKAAQTLHIGPFSEEGPTIKKMHDFIIDNGHNLSGKHHEIYLSDIRRAAPEKWKTIIRQPYT